MDGNVVEINWEPQPRQLTFLNACGLDAPFTGEELKPAKADLVGYGGAAGGGKSDALLGIAMIAAMAYPGIKIAYFRREFPNLEGLGGAIDRSKELIPEEIGKYNQQKHRWRFNNGSMLQFCHAKDIGDERKYKSQQFDILLIDEATEFLPEQIEFLITRNRGTIKVATFVPFTALGTNPGDIGHEWFKSRFVTLGEPEKVHIYTTETGEPRTHIFIPAHLSDNQILEERDPAYRRKLSANELLKRLYLYGDWDVFAGQGLGELKRDFHLVPPFDIKPHWRKFGALDHGYNHPFSFGIYVVNDDGEVYRVGGVKSRLKRPDEQARLMIQACESVGGLDKLDYIVAGHDCWAKGRTGEPSLAEQFLNLPKTHNLPKITLIRAKIDRVQGLNQMRYFLAWKGTKQDTEGNPIDGSPRFFIFSNKNGVEFYTTCASMIFDTDGPHPEDVKKVDANPQGEGGDDMYDEGRYALMSRPRPQVQLEQTPPQNSVFGYIQKKQEERELRRQYVGY